MADAQASHEAVIALNASAAFNVWAGFEVVAASGGEAELRLAWRPVRRLPACGDDRRHDRYRLRLRRVHARR
jgi:hypothetical protein